MKKYSMVDFEQNELEIGDEVIVAYTQFKSTVLCRGNIIKVDIKQAGMTMALVKYKDGSQSRVVGKKIHKVQ